MLDYYVEQGAGIDLVVAPLLRLPRGTIRRCLEIGCSAGFALDFGRFAFGWEVLGVDPSPLATAGARRWDSPSAAPYFNADLDLGPERFDLAICSEVLEHIPEPHSLLAAIHDRLTPGRASRPLDAESRAGAAGRRAGGARSRPQPRFPHGALQPRLPRPGAPERRLCRGPRRGVRRDASRLRGSVSAKGSPGCGRPTRRGASPASRLLRGPGGERRDGVRLRLRIRLSPLQGERQRRPLRARRRRAGRGWRMIYRERFGLDLGLGSGLAGPGNRRAHPFNLTGALFFSGILEPQRARPPRSGRRIFAAAVAAGTFSRDGKIRSGSATGRRASSSRRAASTCRWRSPRRSRTGRCARSKPWRTPGGDRLSAALLAEARAQTFIRLVNAGLRRGRTAGTTGRPRPIRNATRSAPKRSTPPRMLALPGAPRRRRELRARPAAAGRRRILASAVPRDGRLAGLGLCSRPPFPQPTPAVATLPGHRAALRWSCRWTSRRRRLGVRLPSMGFRLPCQALPRSRSAGVLRLEFSPSRIRQVHGVLRAEGLTLVEALRGRRRPAARRSHWTAVARRDRRSRIC